MYRILLLIFILAGCEQQLPDQSTTETTGTSSNQTVDQSTTLPSSSGNSTPAPTYCSSQGYAPGWNAIRRLNNEEYNNTVRDLLGDTTQPANKFAADPKANGFLNNASALTLDEVLLEQYANSAETLVNNALNGSMRNSLIPCDANSSSCQRDALAQFASKAFRRPAQTDEIDHLLTLVDLAISQGDSAETGIGLAMQAVLVSPNFLYRIEENSVSDLVEPLNDYEIAARLSYFLWTSTPDDLLRSLADAGRLQDEGTLKAVVEVMLKDERAKALVDSFGLQWVSMERLDSLTPDPALYPSFNETLRDDMRTETKLFLQEIFSGGHQLDALLRGGFTYVNQNLANHYGLPYSGSGFQRVDTSTTLRQGLLGQGAMLMGTSIPTRTSPAKRGSWVMQTFLCDAPPPPPVAFEFPEEATTDTSGLTFRQQMEQLVTPEPCASCHQTMDPIGFGMENLDVVGQWRNTYHQGGSIDAAGTLPTGSGFSGPEQLSEVISTDPGFGRCVTEQMLTYALGRALLEADQCYIDSIHQDAQNRGGTIPDLITAIVLSDAFRSIGGRQGETR